MSLVIGKRFNPDGSTDFLLISVVEKESAEKALNAISGCRIEITEDDPVLVEQLFNDQYGGIAILNTV